LTLADSDWVYDLATRTETGGTWRLGGATPAITEFFSFIWSGVAVQAAVDARSNRSPIGLIQIFDVNWRSGTAQLAVLFDAAHQNLGWPLEAVALVVDHAFTELGLQRLYAVSAGPVFDTFRSASGSWLNVEATMPAGDSATVYGSIDAHSWDHELVARLMRPRREITHEERMVPRG
jgi:hypothetical protein